MSDEIAKLRQRMEYYRSRSKSETFAPIAAAYAEAADGLEAELRQKCGPGEVLEIKIPLCPG